MANRLAVRKISGYALTKVIPQVNIRNLAAYGIHTKTRVTNFKDKTSAEILLDLINEESIDTYTFANIILGVPEVRTPTGIPKNTRIVVTAVEGQSYNGSVTLRYNRINLARPFADPGSMGFSVGSNTTVHALLATINTAHNLKLSTTDVIDSAVKAGDTGVTLTASTLSYLYIPGSTVRLGIAPPPTIASVITTKALPGFDRVTG